jgi:hypothetical protein
VYATVTLGAGKGTSEDVASARVLIVRAAARSARRIAADMTPQRAARCVFSMIIESNVLGNAFRAPKTESVSRTSPLPFSSLPF